jgi:hypothetical protein
MDGYSKRSLVDKLGIKPDYKIIILNAPEGYDRTLGELPGGVSNAKSLRGAFDFIHFFTTSRAELEGKFLTLKEHLNKNGMLWVSWPKGASKIKTDVNENVVREIALANGLVDVKVAAVDETWSGLKLVYRVKDR